jgi:hypothetical protein
MASVNNPAEPYPPQRGVPPQQPVPAAAPPPAGGILPEGAVPAGTAPAAAVPQQVVVPAQQPVILQPVPVQQAVAPVPERDLERGPVREEAGEPTLRIYSHSNLIYWWPVWTVGFLMALLSAVDGTQVDMFGRLEYFAHSSDLGIIWFITLFLVILISNVPVRGLASGMVIMTIITGTVLLAYFRLWDTVLGWLGHLSIHMNLGAYLFISVLLFVVWVLTVFVFDRMNYWQITPGQVTRERLFGAGQTSYDTRNMVLEKHRNDFFRHWVLGLGSGDLEIRTSGATSQVLHIPNVMFVGQKVLALQRMIAVKPDAFPQAVVRG